MSTYQLYGELCGRCGQRARCRTEIQTRAVQTVTEAINGEPAIVLAVLHRNGLAVSVIEPDNL